MNRLIVKTLLIVLALAIPSFADEKPAPTTCPDARAWTKAKPQKKRISAEQAARSRAMLDAAIEAQGRQVMQAEADRQEAILAEQRMAQAQQAQQLERLRQLNPRAVTMVRTRPDGTSETDTYWVYPNTFPFIG